MAAEPSPQEARLTLIGRAMLEGAGLTDAVIRKTYQRLSEGLDAEKVKIFQHEGEMIADTPRVDFTERRLAAVEIAKLADHYPNKLEHEVHGEVNFRVIGLDGERV